MSSKLTDLVTAAKAALEAVREDIKALQVEEAKLASVVALFGEEPTEQSPVQVADAAESKTPRYSTRSSYNQQRRNSGFPFYSNAQARDFVVTALGTLHESGLEWVTTSQGAELLRENTHQQRYWERQWSKSTLELINKRLVERSSSPASGAKYQYRLTALGVERYTKLDT
ncbi:MAG: hypothetical protein EBZ48_02770 [Proteobacteria bacterium]|nr:hypothetical protein [Pseudomonadota bacterium]